MTEQVKTEEVKTQVEEKIEAPALTEIEQRAVEKGWRPREEYDGDPDRWRSAETFLALEEPIKRIEQQSKELKQIRNVLAEFKQHHTKVKEAEYERALKVLQKQKNQAMIDGEHEKFFELEEQIDEVKAEKEEIVKEAARPIPQEQGPAPEFQAWVSRNKWYSDEPEMRRKADKIGLGYATSGDSPDEVLRQVEQDIRRMYPEKFKNAAASRAAAVEAPTRSGRSPDAGKDDLDEDQRRVMRRFVEQGVITEEQYRADLKKIK